MTYRAIVVCRHVQDTGEVLVSQYPSLRKVALANPPQPMWRGKGVSYAELDFTYINLTFREYQSWEHGVVGVRYHVWTCIEDSEDSILGVLRDTRWWMSR